MKIKEILEDIRPLREGEGKMLQALARQLSPISHETLREYEQKHWMTVERGFPIDSPEYIKIREDFFTGQNKVLKNCLMIETSVIGAAVRKQFGLAPLTMETEITEEP